MSTPQKDMTLRAFFSGLLLVFLGFVIGLLIGLGF
jgi:hypothetical protein